MPTSTSRKYCMTLGYSKFEIMKRIFVTTIILFLLSCGICTAQKASYKSGNSFGLTVNVGASSFANALGWTHLHAFGKNKRLKIGYGIRLTNFFGSDLNFATAPAKYTSGKSSIAALFAENITANIDTITFQKVQTNFVNAGIYFSYTLPYWKNKFEVGVNIDAIGFTFGSAQNALYKNIATQAKPTILNLLLISDSDKGSLNSEWYISYKATPKIAMKIGYQFLFTEYTTNTKIQQIPNSTERNDRFRLKSPMILLGVLFSPFSK
jgi:hypothetical protein